MTCRNTLWRKSRFAVGEFPQQCDGFLLFAQRDQRVGHALAMDSVECSAALHRIAVVGDDHFIVRPRLAAARGLLEVDKVAPEFVVPCFDGVVRAFMEIRLNSAQRLFQLSPNRAPGSTLRCFRDLCGNCPG